MFPLRNGQAWTLTQAQIEAWQADFPALDVPGELRRAHAWCTANPARRKTAAGLPRFLVAWLLRAQTDRASTRAVHPWRPSSQPAAWTCPHTPHCLARGTCQILLDIAAGKRA